MAVYTRLDRAEVAAFIGNFGFHSLSELKATDSGIENTNYFVTACDSHDSERRLVLTLFETVPASTLPYFVELTTYLSSLGLPVPGPFCDRQGQAIQVLKSRPALLVPCFSGAHIRTPNEQQCDAIAAAMATMHLASPSFTLRRDNARGTHWRRNSVNNIATLLNSADRTLLESIANDWEHHLPEIQSLPHGITHSDLFHDNALFSGNKLTGIIDFYQACHDVLIYDLAVLVNDWCSDPEGKLQPQLYERVMLTYQAQRPFSEAEKRLWPRMLQYAALRFWLSRLLSWNDTEARSKVAQKDPEAMKRMLLHRLRSDHIN